MTQLTWGMLEKSMFDDETIEEAIARLISEHNDDEAAHLAEGQSLQSHKASEIIDHVVDSIVADKIKNKEITPNKLNYDRFTIQPSFESLTGWGQRKTGTGADIVIDSVGCFRLVAGNALGNETDLYINSSAVSVSPDYSPVLQCSFNPSTPDDADWGMAIGEWDTFGVSTPKIGMKRVLADNAIYAFYIKDDYPNTPRYVEVKQKIADADDSGKVWRIEVDVENEEVRYYIDNVLKHTFDISGLSFFDSNALFAVSVKNINAGQNGQHYISSILFFQNWQGV